MNPQSTTRDSQQHEPNSSREKREGGSRARAAAAAPPPQTALFPSSVLSLGGGVELSKKGREGERGNGEAVVFFLRFSATATSAKNSAALPEFYSRNNPTLPEYLNSALRLRRRRRVAHRAPVRRRRHSTVASPSRARSAFARQKKNGDSCRMKAAASENSR